jgi:hypothetical protein
MKKVSNRGWKIAMAIWLLVMACNLPSQNASQPTLLPQDIAATSVVLTLAAREGSAGDVTPLPTSPDATVTPVATFTDIPTATVTPCYPMVTANADVNVRAGPGTVYDIIGALPLNSTARVTGQNDSRTWWYIEFPSGSGRYAWVAGSVTASSCIPDGLQYVAAPPTPTQPATATLVPFPDLYVSEYTWSPVPPHMGVSFHVRIGVYNQGNAAAGAFKVQWWLTTSGTGPTCTWGVASLAAHGGRILECDYTPGGWNNAYPSRVVADSSNTINESNEGNNTWSQPLQIAP